MNLREYKNKSEYLCKLDCFGSLFYWSEAMKKIIGLSLNPLLLLSLIYAAFYESCWAYDIAMVMMWVMSILGWLLIPLALFVLNGSVSNNEEVRKKCIPALKELAKGSNSLLNKLINTILSVLIILLAAYCGLVITTIVYAITAIIIKIITSSAKETVDKIHCDTLDFGETK